MKEKGMKCGCRCNKDVKATDKEVMEYPGLATDRGLDDKVDKELVKEATKDLNNNHHGNN